MYRLAHTRSIRFALAPLISEDRRHSPRTRHLSRGCPPPSPRPQQHRTARQQADPYVAVSPNRKRVCTDRFFASSKRHLGCGLGQPRPPNGLRFPSNDRKERAGGRRRRTGASPQSTNGSTMRTPAFAKSERFRVTTVRPWTTAVAAMRLSLIGPAFPVAQRRASSSAHFQARVRVPGQTMDTPHPSVKSAFQRGPLPSRWKKENPESQFAEDDGIDRDVSLMGAKPCHDARVGRWFRPARSVRWRRPNTSPRIRRPRVDGHEEVLLRTGQQPIDGAFVLRSRSPQKAIVPPIEPLDIEHLSRFHPVHLTDFCRQNDLALGGDGSLHGSKIPLRTQGRW